MSEDLRAYCVKCRAKRRLESPQAVWNANRTPATRGVCAACGTGMFRMGATPAHESLPRPKRPPTPPKSRQPRKTTTTRGGQTKKGAARAPRKIDKLVIVESPTKARSVGNFLGRDYRVEASIGHVRDLKRGANAVDIANDFEPSWSIPKKKREVVKKLGAYAQAAQEIYLATDPDREGEAIAWHLADAASMDAGKTHRVVFHEITDNAVREAFANPRGINRERVNAYLARRILDRLVGYDLGSVLKRKVSKQLTAGRVQSVAVRLVVEREREIQAFTPQEYWTIDCELRQRPRNGGSLAPAFRARLIRTDGKDIRPVPGSSPASEEETGLLVADLERSQYRVQAIRRGNTTSRPAAPFTTSTLQQTASNRLGMNPANTMRVAQQLYQGIALGAEGAVGLITYMRTDSVNVSKQAQTEARGFIRERFGADHLPEKPPVYRTRARAAQEAHEAIRPTGVARHPESLRDALDREQLRLYTLIWQRFVGSQMAPARYDTLRVDIAAGPHEDGARHLFRASSRTLRFPGHLALNPGAEKREPGAQLPPDLARGAALDLLQLLPAQHFTSPPSRFSEASLVRTLEEHGIGRPSTYASIIGKIKQRHYVTREGRNLVPTEIGATVVDLLLEYFPNVMNYEFTAQLEDQLDEIAADRLAWRPMLGEFYAPFSERLQHAREHMPHRPIEKPLGRDCPKCGGAQTLVTKLGRYGMFIACSNFPDCDHRESLGMDIPCPQCGAAHGGELGERRSKNGRVFYGCLRYPECEFTTWNRPLRQPCPACGKLLLERSNRAHCTGCERQFAPDELQPAAAKSA